jgi:hypothetical protein
MRSDIESDEFVTVSYEATKVRKRDFLRVLLGRWTPTVRRVERLTAKGISRELKKAWTPEALEAQKLTEHPLLSMLDGQSGVVPLVREEG